MKTMKRIYLLVVAASLLMITGSCSKDDTNGANETPLKIDQGNYTFLKSGSLYDEAKRDRSENYSSPFEIDSVIRTGDIMDITVSFPAGCETNKFEVIWDGVILESYPVQTRIFVRRTASGCPESDETKSEVLSVDLNELIFNGNDEQLQNAIVIVSNASKNPDSDSADLPLVLNND
jgi:hypothetical protein